jgi:hypothetical protein
MAVQMRGGLPLALLFGLTLSPRLVRFQRAWTSKFREPMGNAPSDQLARRSPTVWMIVVALVLLNIWYDCYHPLGIMFDLVLAVGLLIWYLSKSKPV